MAQGATRPWSTYLFSAEKMPESHIPSKSIISIHTPISASSPRAAYSATKASRLAASALTNRFLGRLKQTPSGAASSGNCYGTD